MHVTLKAEYQSHDLEKGTVTVEIPTSSLSDKEPQMLDYLFPNTRSGIERLLMIEAMIPCIVK